MNTQLIPPSDAFVANMPSGRDMYPTKPFVPPTLDEDTLASMRAPPDREGTIGDGDESSSDEDKRPQQSVLPGGFPESSVAASTDNSYY